MFAGARWPRCVLSLDLVSLANPAIYLDVGFRDNLRVLMLHDFDDFLNHSFLYFLLDTFAESFLLYFLLDTGPAPCVCPWLGGVCLMVLLSLSGVRVSRRMI